MNDTLIMQTKGYLQEIIKQYPTNREAIAKLKEKYMCLKINGLEDREGYSVVHAARIEMKSLRIALEKAYKAFNEEAKIFTTGIRKEKNELMSLCDPIESHLHEQEKAIDDEKARIKHEVEEKEALRIQKRIRNLYDMGMTFNGFGYVYLGLDEIPTEAIKEMTDDEYQETINKLTDIKKIEAEKQAETERQEKEEKERQAKIRQEQEQIRKEQEQKEAELRAERKKIEKEKADVDEKRWRFRLGQLKCAGWNGQEAFDQETKELIITIDDLIDWNDDSFNNLLDIHNKLIDDRVAKAKEEIEFVKKQAAEKAIKEAKEQKERETKEKAEKERIAKMESELAEKLKPDNEKLLTLANDIGYLKMPELANDQSHDILNKARGHLNRAVQILRQL